MDFMTITEWLKVLDEPVVWSSCVCLSELNSAFLYVYKPLGAPHVLSAARSLSIKTKQKTLLARDHGSCCFQR